MNNRTWIVTATLGMLAVSGAGMTEDACDQKQNRDAADNDSSLASRSHLDSGHKVSNVVYRLVLRGGRFDRCDLDGFDAVVVDQRPLQNGLGSREFGHHIRGTLVFFPDYQVNLAIR